MLVIPAVDIRGGRCVRLTQGRFEEETVYYDDPVQAAQHWQDQGAEYLHVVDLDGALTGEPKNIEILGRILEAVDIPLEFGGGIRTEEVAGKVLKMGTDRVILGTRVVDCPELIERLCLKNPGRVAVSLDYRGGRVAVKGWVESSQKELLEVAREVEKARPRAIIFTDITRDGTLKGPDIDFLKELLKMVSVPVIVSGGIASLEHLRALSLLPIEGVVVGKALYSGAIRLAEATLVSNPPQTDIVNP